MIGFELEIKGQKISVESIEGGVVTLIADIVKGKATLNFGGMEFKENGKKEALEWLKEMNLVDGDEFTVRVKNIENPSEPVEIREVDFSEKR